MTVAASGKIRAGDRVLVFQGLSDEVEVPPAAGETVNADQRAAAAIEPPLEIIDLVKAMGSEAQITPLRHRHA
jgi:hypothetical protein